jgi:hypothetical protein
MDVSLFWPCLGDSTDQPEEVTLPFPEQSVNDTEAPVSSAQLPQDTKAVTKRHGPATLSGYPESDVDDFELRMLHLTNYLAVR